MSNLFLVLISIFLNLPLQAQAQSPCENLKRNVKEGDILFLEIDKLPFRQVAQTSQSWTSHVGIVFQNNGKWVVYESAIPRSGSTELCKYLKKSKNEKFALTRYDRGLTYDQVARLKEKAQSLFGIFYDTGFDFDSRRQFCSKFVYEVYQSIGIKVGEVITFQNLFDSLPANKAREELVTFWKRWFYAGMRFSGIPWERRTVTPASQLLDRKFTLILGSRK